MGQGVLGQYKEFLPITLNTPMLSMGEGDTPLVKSRRLGEEFGIGALYFKLEGCNPSGSFKDRGMVLAVAKAVEDGFSTILCASTGNTSASAAAYGAAAGLKTVVLVPDGQITEGKMSQAVAYGARVVKLDGNFDDSLRIARALADHYEIALVNSVNPYRIEGQKTAAYEIVDILGEAPDFLCIPVGNAGNITAYWQGFKECAELERATQRPKMMGFQAAGAAPIVVGHPIANPQTIASAIRIGNPASWSSAITARDESGGVIDMVTDEEILEAYKLLARREGIFCEPASAASVAGLIKITRSGTDLRSSTVACVITGHGLKDPSVALGLADRPPDQAPPDLAVVAALLGVSAKSDV